MEYLKTFNEKENKIHELCCEKKVDYKKIDELLKNGASANAVEITKYDNDEEPEEELLLIQCWLDGQSSRRFDEEENLVDEEIDFCFNLLQIFIDNGLDIDRYVNHIFNNIQFTYDEKNYIDMTKLILNNLKNKDNLILEKALDGIGTEESYNNCCRVDHKYANVLSTIYEMIEKFKEDKDPNLYFNCDKVIGQKMKEVSIFSKDLKVDMDNKLISDEIEILINCENDKLNIFNKYIFVNNNNESTKFERLESDNRFEKSLNNYLKDETINNIKFYNDEISARPKANYNVTRIEIEVSNDKKVIINLDESLSFMKVTII